MFETQELQADKQKSGVNPYENPSECAVMLKVTMQLRSSLRERNVVPIRATFAVHCMGARSHLYGRHRRHSFPFVKNTKHAIGKFLGFFGEFQCVLAVFSCRKLRDRIQRGGFGRGECW